MPPNSVEPSSNIESVSKMSKFETMPSAPTPISTGRYLLLIIQACLNLTAYVLLGILVGVSIVFAYRNGTNLSMMDLHVVLCVVGYQLLMGVGILALTSESGFSVSMSLKHKRWLHSFLLTVGSVLAIVGSILVSVAKPTNFNTLHGKFSLAAMAFTIACLFNGVSSLYAHEWRRYLPANLSKLTHILFGIVAFAMATVSLCYGFKKSTFRGWATQEVTDVLYILTGIFTAICIINPFITFFSKMKNACSK